MIVQKKGRDVLLAYTEEYGSALDEACELHCDNDACAAQVFCNVWRNKTKPFKRLKENAG